MIKVGWCYWCPCKTPTVWSNLILAVLFWSRIPIVVILYRKINKNKIYQIISRSCGTYHWDPRESLASQPMTCDPLVLRDIVSCGWARNRWPRFGDMSWILHLDIMTWQIVIMNHSRCSWTIQTQQDKIACGMNMHLRNMSQQQAMLHLFNSIFPTRNSKAQLLSNARNNMTWRGLHVNCQTYYIMMHVGLEIPQLPKSLSTANLNIFHTLSNHRDQTKWNHTKSTWLL